MSERLKQIWGRFESVTRRELTGGGVDNIPTPEPAARRGEALPQGFEGDAPSKAGLSALKTAARAEHTKEARREKKRRARRGEPEAAETGRAVFGASDLIAPESASVEGFRDFRHDVLETARRTVRGETDYLAWATARARAELESAHRRKKFLGIF